MNTLRTLIVTLAVLGLASPAFAKPLLAVLDFSESRSELHSDELSVLGDVSRGAALEVLGHRYDVITRENLVDLLKAHGKSLDKCSGECETETGRLLGAELVVSGRIVKAFGKYKVNLKVHRTDPPALLGAEMMTADDHGGLETAVRTGTERLLANVPGARGAPAPSPARDAATEEGASLRTSLKRAAKGVAKKALDEVIERSKDEREEAEKAQEAEEDQDPEEQDQDWRGDTEWFGLYGATGQISQYDGLDSATGGGIVVEFLKFRFPFGETSYGFLGLGGARIMTSGTDLEGGQLYSATLSGALMVGYGYALGARQGLELSVGYGSGSYERDGDFLGVISHDVNGLQSTLSYHYRLDSMSIRGGFLTQYLMLNDEIGNSVQVSVGFAGVAF